MGGSLVLVVGGYRGEGHGKGIVLFTDVPEGIPCWVHLAEHSSSRNLPSPFSKVP